MMNIGEGVRAVADHLKVEAANLLHAAERSDMYVPVKGFLGGVASYASGVVERVGTHIMAIDDQEQVHTDQTEHFDA